MKRTRGRVRHYDVPDDEDECSSGARTPTEKHAHVDWGRRNNRPSARTSYVDIPISPNKRQRQRASSTPPSSMPSLATDDCSSFHDRLTQPIDINYLYQQIQELSDDPQPRRRTAGVSLSFPLAACDRIFILGCGRTVPSCSGLLKPTVTWLNCCVLKVVEMTSIAPAAVARRGPFTAVRIAPTSVCIASSVLWRTTSLIPFIVFGYVSHSLHSTSVLTATLFMIALGL